jgi:hypothetical protein
MSILTLAQSIDRSIRHLDKSLRGDNEESSASDRRQIAIANPLTIRGDFTPLNADISYLVTVSLNPVTLVAGGSQKRWRPGVGSERQSRPN